MLVVLCISNIKLMASDFLVKNETSIPIVVVMDSGREIHAIVPAGSAEFVRAKIGDRVTFHVFNDLAATGKAEAPNKEVAAHKIGFKAAIKSSGTWIWNGSELK